MNQSVWINRFMLGGPLAEDRGFILHTPPSNFASSIRISDNTVMTTSRDVLETLGTDKQPSDVLVALGYASWEKGQLEQEILDNAWLTAPADLNILFKTPIADRWREAAKLIGVDILTMLVWQGTPDEWNLTRLRLRHQKHWRSGRPTHYRHCSPFACN
ncbi:protein YqgE [Escherichia coli]|uniref:Protein YqgE n=1 Tax=Escherichia coli TaxID=562 RepID=A0A2X3JAZ8_ECOLX|nr:protein YqgE [Escherichia coli]